MVFSWVLWSRFYLNNKNVIKSFTQTVVCLLTLIKLLNTIRCEIFISGTDLASDASILHLPGLNVVLMRFETRIIQVFSGWLD